MNKIFFFILSLKDIDEKYIDLSKENQMLNQVVKDYESTLDIIMNKYRLQTVINKFFKIIMKF